MSGDGSAAAKTARRATAKKPALPAFSVVLPAKDEAAAIAGVIEELGDVLGAKNLEVLVIDDGSTDSTADVVRSLMARYGWLRLIVHDRCAGQSAALRSGVMAARAPVIVTMDADGQSDPRDFEDLLLRLETGGARLGMVSGQRTKRQDNWLKRVSSRVANATRRRILADDAADSACPVRAARREVLLALPYFDHMHRFMPALVKREGLEVMVVPVRHRPRAAGQSKYGMWDRLAVGLVDLFGVWWLLRRRNTVPNVKEIAG